MSNVSNTLACITGGFLLISSGAQAGIVELGSLTRVFAEAPLFDARSSSDYGCDPEGCVATLTRVSGLGLRRVFCSRVEDRGFERPNSIFGRFQNAYMMSKLNDRVGSTQIWNMNHRLPLLCIL